MAITIADWTDKKHSNPIPLVYVTLHQMEKIELKKGEGMIVFSVWESEQKYLDAKNNTAMEATGQYELYPPGTIMGEVDVSGQPDYTQPIMAEIMRPKHYDLSYALGVIRVPISLSGFLQVFGTLVIDGEVVGQAFTRAIYQVAKTTSQLNQWGEITDKDEPGSAIPVNGQPVE